LDSIAVPKWRGQFHRDAGDAILPQVALEICRSIEPVDRLMTQNGGGPEYIAFFNRVNGFVIQ
jgi:hypothetical protein